MTAILDKHPPLHYQDHLPSGSRLWSQHYLLFLENVTAVFDGFTALDIPAIGVEHNELRVIIGPNGAGKTTFCDVVTGKTAPTTGKIYFDEADITEESEAEIFLRGVGRKFQTPTVFDSLTTYQNMELALPGNQKVWPNLFAKQRTEERDRIYSILERVKLDDDAHTEAKYLSHGQRQWLAISALILSSPKLLLVDEPAAGLTDSETELTAELLLELKKEHTLIVIEHDMDFVRHLDARVTVLCEGKPMAEGSMSVVQNNEAVIEAYLGR
ncbi:MAG: urea transport system ATP-binding protein [Kiritimatiellia bacterium]|jgi:urea transport system ATP-binding protein